MAKNEYARENETRTRRGFAKRTTNHEEDGRRDEGVGESNDWKKRCGREEAEVANESRARERVELVAGLGWCDGRRGRVNRGNSIIKEKCDLKELESRKERSFFQSEVGAFIERPHAKTNEAMMNVTSFRLLHTRCSRRGAVLGVYGGEALA